MNKILKEGFKKANSLKILFLYGHGEGATGFKDREFNLIKNEIKQFIKDRNGQKIDLIIYDSCFLGNVEFLYEMRELSKFSMASSESEFSQGQPFEVLDSLAIMANEGNEKETSIKKIASQLLVKFLSSYSTIEQGKNSKSVNSSSAVFSLYDNSKLDFVLSDLKKIKEELNKLNSETRNLLNRKWQKFSMDDERLIDLGGFLRVLEQEKINDRITDLARTLLDKLNITEADFKTVSPLIQMRSPFPNEAIAIVSVNNKNKTDLERILPSFKNQINSTYLKDGEVALKVNKLLRIAPFYPHIRSIEIRFIDPKTGKNLGESKQIHRTKDLKIHENKSSSPIQFFGFTESQKTIEKRYSGINISNPFKPMPNFDYLNLEFQSKTQWLK